MRHFICDYLLQNRYMLGKFNAKGWVLPLAAHVGTVAIGTWIITFFITYNFVLAIELMIIDFIIHFSMDRIKASPYIFGKLKPDNPRFWRVLGTDQTVHHFTDLILASIIMFIIIGC